jgi:hypothetical protein
VSMTYVQIQNAVLADGFDETKRSDAKQWIQFRHAWLWDLEEWAFRFGTQTVTFTANSQTVGSMPTNFRAAVALYDANGTPIHGVRDLREFYNRYNANLSNGTGTPEAYTVVDSALIVGPAGDGSSGLLIYEKSKPTLSADSDTTGLPDGYDLALVHGAKAEGFKLTNVPLWQGFDEDFTAATNALRRDYLSQVREQGQQFGAYRPGR